MIYRTIRSIVFRLFKTEVVEHKEEIRYLKQNQNNTARKSRYFHNDESTYIISIYHLRVKISVSTLVYIHKKIVFLSNEYVIYIYWK